ncbi:MAG: PDZ domain-containing protein [Prosthecobacter sp.]|jgi:S1-C subfamily serine protease|nr:PDZ domain-containing protein [Prosthecobacter sp.]
MKPRPCLIACLFAASISQAAPRAPLPPEERTNGAQELGKIQPALPIVRASAAQILSAKGRPLATAVWVGADGYFLTKASETPELEDCRIRWADGKSAAIRQIHRLPSLDLALAQAIGVTGVSPAHFTATAPQPPYGQWLAAPTHGGQEMRIGVISAQPRKIPGLGPAMGIRMDEKTALGGVRITGIAEDSPAAAAALEPGDILTHIGQEPATDVRTVHEIIRRHQAGDLVTIAYLRGGSARTARIRLASRTRIIMNWEGEDFANGGISIRTDDYPRILQHDLPLAPQDMGGALFDLTGQAIGINIARVDRVTTFALPASAFWPQIQPLIQADRHPPKALPAAP